jgi:MOSC domain-containing protein YiiM
VSGTLVAVSVGTPRAIETAGGRVVRTAIFKAPAAGRVAVTGVNLAGDDQADRSVHGGPDKAVYAYASEDTAWWTAEGRPGLGPGAFGENLTTAGVDVSGAVVGERWTVGTTELEVCQPRLPCFKLGLRMGDPSFVKAFGRAGRPGAYLRIVREGDVGAGDAVEVVHRPEHGVTVALVAHVFLHDRGRLAELAPATELPAGWRAFIAERAPAG